MAADTNKNALISATMDVAAENGLIRYFLPTAIRSTRAKYASATTMSRKSFLRTSSVFKFH